ncbi:MAG: hypothetical protein ACOYB0_09640 [Polynucleobacter sp.]
MDECERIRALETKMERVTQDLLEIKIEQTEARDRERNQAIDMGKLTMQLEGLLDRLDKLSARRFSWANTLIALCGVLILVFNLLITMPAIQNANRIAQAQSSGQSIKSP